MMRLVKPMAHQSVVCFLVAVLAVCHMYIACNAGNISYVVLSECSGSIGGPDLVDTLPQELCFDEPGVGAALATDDDEVAADLPGTCRRLEVPLASDALEEKVAPSSVSLRIEPESDCDEDGEEELPEHDVVLDVDKDGKLEVAKVCEDRTKAASPSKATVFYDRLPPCPVEMDHKPTTPAEQRVALGIQASRGRGGRGGPGSRGGRGGRGGRGRGQGRGRKPKACDEEEDEEMEENDHEEQEEQAEPPSATDIEEDEDDDEGPPAGKGARKAPKAKAAPKKAASAPKAKAKATAKAATKAKAKATPKAKGKAGKKGKLAKEEEEHEVPSNKRKRSDPAPKVTAKPKTKAAAKPASKNGAADAAADKKAERSRKSVAYHRAVKEAKQSGKTDDQAKEAGKKAPKLY